MATRRNLWPWLFLSPFLLGFGVFFAWPLLRSVGMSFERDAGTGAARFAGLANYRFAAGDVLLWGGLLNTLAFTLLFLIVQVPASLGLALLLDGRRVVARPLFRFVFFSTHLVGVVFAAVLFSTLLSGRMSPVNKLLLLSGMIDQPADLLQSPFLAMPLLLGCAWYLSIGFGMIYCLAALQGIDRDLYDAATADGAGAWARFRHVTLPQVRPTLSFLTVAGAVWGLQLFELPYVLFNGPGPGYRGLTAVMYLFSVAFVDGDLGYASAVGWCFVGVVLLVTLGLARLLGLGREDVTLA